MDYIVYIHENAYIYIYKNNKNQQGRELPFKTSKDVNYRSGT